MINFVKQIYKKDNAYLKKTVFCDRDGTLIKEVNYLSNSREIAILSNALKGLKKLNRNKIVIIVISNQPVVARGKATIRGVKLINDTLVKELSNKGVYINAVYFCPHHPEKNHSDIPNYAMKYRVKCKCRKPKLAMFKQAIKDFNVNLKSAYVVGDRTRDIKAGEDLGVKTILVKTGYKGMDNTYKISPDFISNDFSRAADIIIKS